MNAVRRAKRVLFFLYVTVPLWIGPGAVAQATGDTLHPVQRQNDSVIISRQGHDTMPAVQAPSDTLIGFRQNTHVRPRIGVTLSGGGAKGLAHIGILKSIDSAGLKVDAITGTSMGSIIGGLYAAGYSADTLEKIARQIDWASLLSNQTNLTSLKMEEKDEYGKYALELPWMGGAFQLPTGLLEAEELWLKFSELFYPVYATKDFTKLSIPFKCVATNISDGSIVVLDKGELIKAIRSSMAIPTVFTAVSIDSVMLVDGGVVRNFPVQEVRDMGANLVIGSSVANGLLPTKKINNVLQVLLQIAFFKEAEDNKHQQAMTDLYIFHPMHGYNAASFGRSSDIIDLGLRKGRQFYPEIKQLKDSLDRIYGPQPDTLNRLPRIDTVHISAIRIKGLVKTDSVFFVDMLGYKGPRAYTVHELTLMARRIYGTRYYSKVFYYLEPNPDGTALLVFEVSENPTTEAKVGINYNIFSGAAIIGNLTTRNYFTKNSRTLLTVNIGQTFRIRGEHLQYLGKHNQTAMILSAQYESPEYNSYDNFRKDGLYRNDYTVADLRIQRSVNRLVSLGLGTRFENTALRPLLPAQLEVRGQNNFFTSYPYFQFNTQDRWTYPRSGWKVDAEYDLTYGQNPDFQVTENGSQVSADSLNSNVNDYTRFLLNASEYVPLGKKSTFSWQLQAGINFRYQVNRVNDFSVGGLTPQFHNQIVFAGLAEGTVNTSSIQVLAAEYRYEAYPLVYLTARVNAAMYNFLNVQDNLVNPKYLTGAALSLGYDSPIGPIEFSAMYCSQSQQILPYVNIGIHF